MGKEDKPKLTPEDEALFSELDHTPEFHLQLYEHLLTTWAELRKEREGDDLPIFVPINYTEDDVDKVLNVPFNLMVDNVFEVLEVGQAKILIDMGQKEQVVKISKAVGAKYRTI